MNIGDERGTKYRDKEKGLRREGEKRKENGRSWARMRENGNKKKLNERENKIKSESEKKM